MTYSDSFVRPTEREVALGFHGLDVPAAGLTGSVPAAREALEAAVLTPLLSGRPTYVSFSGGRDSSAVLATAVHVARREGLALPVPIIRRHPGDPGADETEWQELVLDHLNLQNARIIEVSRSSTYLDDDAQANLRRRGLVFSPSLQLRNPILEAAAGGALLTGEGGDEILGTRRVTPLTLLLRYRRKPSRALLSWLSQSLLPATLSMRHRYTTAIAPASAWLTQRAHREMCKLDVGAYPPLHAGHETVLIERQRIARVMLHNYGVVAEEHGVTLLHPLRSRMFVASLARDLGRWGFAGRTDAMRRLFSDILPERLLGRQTKAHFDGVRWGVPEREFARHWDGTGLDRSLVDVERVRSEWLSPVPSGASVLALHAAWLHQQGIPVTGMGMA